MEPTWVLSAPDEPQGGPMNFAITSDDPVYIDSFVNFRSPKNYNTSSRENRFQLSGVSNIGH